MQGAGAAEGAADLETANGLAHVVDRGTLWLQGGTGSLPGPRNTKIADEALDTLIATGKATAIDQILPDGLGIAAFGES